MTTATDTIATRPEPSEHTFRTSTHVERAAAALDWLNTGVFVSVGGRQASGVVHETYLVQ